jgi:redox-sensitive bicupin YhaK (pirin superfamily)
MTNIVSFLEALRQKATPDPFKTLSAEAAKGCVKQHLKDSLENLSGLASALRRCVGPHPHEGFERASMFYQGGLKPRDSSGGSGRIGRGDAPGNTAGKGIVHEKFRTLDFTRKCDFSKTSKANGASNFVGISWPFHLKFSFILMWATSPSTTGGGLE